MGNANAIATIHPGACSVDVNLERKGSASSRRVAVLVKDDPMAEHKRLTASNRDQLLVLSVFWTRPVLCGDAQSYFTVAVAGLKKSANIWPFGVPIPVTLSHPTFVWSAEGLLQGVPKPESAGWTEQSVPKETTSAVS